MHKEFSCSPHFIGFEKLKIIRHRIYTAHNSLSTIENKTVQLNIRIKTLGQLHIVIQFLIKKIVKRAPHYALLSGK